MSVQNPLRLQNLAGKSLLTDEALAISTLEYLPIELFPQLFMEAFCGRHRKTLKALVQAWPFVRLPLGGLMQTPHLGTLQAVLDGLDVLLAQKDQPRRCKLRVLDLRNSGQDFWRMWSGSKIHVSSSSSMVPCAVDSLRAEKPLAPFKVFIELHLKERSMDGFLTYLLKWVEERKASIHLCCKRLRILSFPMENIMKVLSMVRLDCIQEVHVNCTWYLPTLAMFAPLLGQISKVQRLLISHIHLPAPMEQDKQHVVKITSQFLRMHHLRDLHLESPFYLEGCLDQMLRCLMTPLDTLTITRCLLTDSDLTHLSQSPKISQLKGLNLSGVTMTYSSPELLPALLQKVSATLQELYLEQCGIRDFHLEFLLPALSLCIQLTSFSLRGNFLSMATMEKMLRHTSGMLSSSRELYTVPQESLSCQGILQPSRLAQCRTELLEILKDLGRPRTIWICFTPCPHCGDNTFYHPEPIIYSSNTLT
ncbi:melanoma antigen preferentially expressed in tumors-like [Dama dama]|uniref:melanoma antigen preferentially expressed in tumors-like n=1 Tax=Dama dama TaxID=30532 RepID=UPI002A369CE4|nr:melanoma antigen preferentially expressed in tumors-like [Dama dama]